MRSMSWSRTRVQPPRMPKGLARPKKLIRTPDATMQIRHLPNASAQVQIYDSNLFQ